MRSLSSVASILMFCAAVANTQTSAAASLMDAVEVVTYVDLSPERAESASSLLIKQVQQEQRSSGCTTVVLLEENGRPNHFVLIERWRSVRDLDIMRSSDELFAVNAKGPYFTVQKFAPLMREGSSVVFTTSVVNVLGYPMVSAYAATKAVLRSMARSLARELLPRGIRVNAVSPGPIKTSVLSGVMPPDAIEKTYANMAEENPMKRVGTAEEIAIAVAFLLFDATYTPTNTGDNPGTA